MIKLHPGKAELYSSLAYAYGRKGDVDQEIKNYKASLRYDSEDDMVFLNLAMAYEKKKMYKDALREYTNAYQLNPGSTKAAQKIPEMRIKMLREKYR